MEKIEQIHKEFGVDVNIAITAFYTWRSINIAASDSKDILQGLNKNSLSWNIITHSLQNTFFIAMGRIFDTDHEEGEEVEIDTYCENVIIDLKSIKSFANFLIP